jgi:hypothetical protein
MTLNLTPADRAAWAVYLAENARSKRAYRLHIQSPVDTDAETRELHRRYCKGERSDEVVEGERRYQRDRKRKYRKGAS